MTSASLSEATLRIFFDIYNFFKTLFGLIIDFVLPKWTSHYYHDMPALTDLWHQYIVSDLRRLDSDGDGHISSQELLTNMKAFLHQYSPTTARRAESWATWFSREWPLMDWKVGIFIWKSFGGILVALAICSIMPGRLHGISARILRWPLLGLVYFLISVELLVYIVIRIGIGCAEYIIARPKHRRLRRLMHASKSYEEWHEYAAQLDKSQKRDKWLQQMDDHTSYEYNWGFILELISEMRLAREKGDAILALAVVQQCTRKNVGGIMSEDLFSYSNTGEPKAIVREFVDEVVTTLHWITDQASGKTAQDMSSRELLESEHRLQREVREEKTKLLGSLIDATCTTNESHDDNGNHCTNGNGHCRSDSTPSTKSLPVIHQDQVLLFLKRARAAYGRTSFCMSGGAMLVNALIASTCLFYLHHHSDMLTKDSFLNTGMLSLWSRSRTA
jgi:hypothetical protein